MTTENKEKEGISRENLLSLLASSTSRPGLANPPVSIWREAWFSLIKNAWIINFITGISTLGAGWMLGLAGRNMEIVTLLLAAGIALLAGGILFWAFFLLTALYLKVTPP